MIFFTLKTFFICSLAIWYLMYFHYSFMWELEYNYIFLPFLPFKTLPFSSCKFMASSFSYHMYKWDIYLCRNKYIFLNTWIRHAQIVWTSWARTMRDIAKWGKKFQKASALHKELQAAKARWEKEKWMAFPKKEITSWLHNSKHTSMAAHRQATSCFDVFSHSKEHPVPASRCLVLVQSTPDTCRYFQRDHHKTNLCEC